MRLGRDLRNLSELRHFRHIEDEELAALDAYGSWCELGPGEVLVEGGDESHRAWLLVSGRLSVRDARGRELGEAWPGDVIGEAALYGLLRRASAWVVARTPSTVVRLDAERFSEQHATRLHGAIQRHLLEAVARRVSRTDQLRRREWAARSEQARPADEVVPSTVRHETPSEDWTHTLPAALGLRGVEPEHVRRVVGGALRSLDPETVLCTQGDPSSVLWFLLEGSLALTKRRFDGRMHHIGHIAAPTLVGTIGLVAGVPRSATMTCRGPVTVATLSQERFMALLEADDAEGALLRDMVLSELVSAMLRSTADLARLRQSRQRSDDLDLALGRVRVLVEEWCGRDDPSRPHGEPAR